MSCTRCAPKYCAPNRCYCGHTECTAFASYVAREDMTLDRRQTREFNAHRASWRDREPDTWLDKM